MVERRTMEMATAAALAAFGGAVIAGSLQLHVGWAPQTGPQSGYFPFRLGLLLCGASAILFLQAAMSARHGAAFASREQALRSLSIFVPTVLLVLAMTWGGTYAPTALYLFYMARRHGGFGRPKAAAIAVVAVVALYLLFETWFQVPLAKGPLEAWVGLQ
jgi:hypothetical protein